MSQSQISRLVTEVSDELNIDIPECEYSSVIQEIRNLVKLKLHLPESMDLDEDIEEVQMTLVCELCKATFSSWSLLQLHEQWHTEAAWSCHLCTSAFVNRQSLHKHMQHHTRKSLYHMQSGKCSDKSKSPAYIKCPTGQSKSASCEICKRQFQTKGIMKRHVQTVHMKIRKFKCDMCDLSFRMRSHLKVHQQKHTSELLYSCEVCNRCFKQIGSRNRHQSRHKINIVTNDERSKQTPDVNIKSDSSNSCSINFHVTNKDREFVCPGSMELNKQSNDAGATCKVNKTLNPTSQLVSAIKADNIKLFGDVTLKNLQIRLTDCMVSMKTKISSPSELDNVSDIRCKLREKLRKSQARRDEMLMNKDGLRNKIPFHNQLDATNRDVETLSNRSASETKVVNSDSDDAPDGIQVMDNNSEVKNMRNPEADRNVEFGGFKQEDNDLIDDATESIPSHSDNPVVEPDLGQTNITTKLDVDIARTVCPIYRSEDTGKYAIDDLPTLVKLKPVGNIREYGRNHKTETLSLTDSASDEVAYSSLINRALPPERGMTVITYMPAISKTKELSIQQAENVYTDGSESKHSEMILDSQKMDTVLEDKVSDDSSTMRYNETDHMLNVQNANNIHENAKCLLNTNESDIVMPVVVGVRSLANETSCWNEDLLNDETGETNSYIGNKFENCLHEEIPQHDNEETNKIKQFISKEGRLDAASSELLHDIQVLYREEYQLKNTIDKHWTAADDNNSAAGYLEKEEQNLQRINFIERVMSGNKHEPGSVDKVSDNSPLPLVIRRAAFVRERIEEKETAHTMLKYEKRSIKYQRKNQRQPLEVFPNEKSNAHEKSERSAGPSESLQVNENTPVFVSLLESPSSHTISSSQIVVSPQTVTADTQDVYSTIMDPFPVQMFRNVQQKRKSTGEDMQCDEPLPTATSNEPEKPQKKRKTDTVATEPSKPPARITLEPKSRFVVQTQRNVLLSPGLSVCSTGIPQLPATPDEPSTEVNQSDQILKVPVIPKSNETSIVSVKSETMEQTSDVAQTISLPTSKPSNTAVPKSIQSNTTINSGTVYDVFWEHDTWSFSNYKNKNSRNLGDKFNVLKQGQKQSQKQSQKDVMNSTQLTDFLFQHLKSLVAVIHKVTKQGPRSELLRLKSHIDVVTNAMKTNPNSQIHLLPFPANKGLLSSLFSPILQSQNHLLLAALKCAVIMALTTANQEKSAAILPEVADSTCRSVINTSNQEKKEQADTTNANTKSMTLPVTIAQADVNDARRAPVVEQSECNEIIETGKDSAKDNEVVNNYQFSNKTFSMTVEGDECPTVDTQQDLEHLLNEESGEVNISSIEGCKEKANKEPNKITPHVKVLVDGKENLLCVICNLSFDPRFFNSHLKLHMLDHYPHVCEICNASFSCWGLLQLHQQWHIHDTFKCNICPSYFDSKANLNVHLQTHVESSNPVKYPISKEVFSSEKFFAAHSTGKHSRIMVQEHNLNVLKATNLENSKGDKRELEKSERSSTASCKEENSSECGDKSLNITDNSVENSMSRNLIPTELKNRPCSPAYTESVEKRSSVNIEELKHSRIMVQQHNLNVSKATNLENSKGDKRELEKSERSSTASCKRENSSEFSDTSLNITDNSVESSVSRNLIPTELINRPCSPAYTESVEKRSSVNIEELKSHLTQLEQQKNELQKILKIKRQLELVEKVGKQSKSFGNACELTHDDDITCAESIQMDDDPEAKRAIVQKKRLKSKLPVKISCNMPEMMREREHKRKVKAVRQLLFMFGRGDWMKQVDISVMNDDGVKDMILFYDKWLKISQEQCRCQEDLQMLKEFLNKQLFRDCFDEKLAMKCVVKLVDLSSNSLNRLKTVKKAAIHIKNTMQDEFGNLNSKYVTKVDDTQLKKNTESCNEYVITVENVEEEPAAIELNRDNCIDDEHSEFNTNSASIDFDTPSEVDNDANKDIAYNGSDDVCHTKATSFEGEIATHSSTATSDNKQLFQFAIDSDVDNATLKAYDTLKAFQTSSNVSNILELNRSIENYVKSGGDLDVVQSVAEILNFKLEWNEPDNECNAENDAGDDDGLATWFKTEKM